LITEVACHEVAHVAARELHGDGCRPHGPEWCKLVRAAGFQPSLRVAVAGPEPKTRKSPPESVLYEHRCLTCNAMRTARRPMVHWRCSECVAAGLSGKLTIISRPVARKAKSDE
jgi:predicted SprT family Zn-dependent metalloprotease